MLTLNCGTWKDLSEIGFWFTLQINVIAYKKHIYLYITSMCVLFIYLFLHINFLCNPGSVSMQGTTESSSSFWWRTKEHSAVIWETTLNYLYHRWQCYHFEFFFWNTYPYMLFWESMQNGHSFVLSHFHYLSPSLLVSLPHVKL